VENALKTSDKLTVLAVATDVIEKRILVAVDVQDDDDDGEIRALVKKEIESVSVECEEMQESLVMDMHSSPAAPAKRPQTVKKTSRFVKILRNPWLQGAVGLATGIALMAVMMAGVGIPLVGMIAIACASTLLTAYLGHETYFQAVKKLIKAKTLTMDALFTVSTLAALGVSIASFFVPWLKMMFDVPLLIFGFRHIGEGIKKAAKRKVVSGLSFKDRAPKLVRVLVDGKWVKRPIAQVAVNDVILVRKGEVIPLNGRCRTQQSSVDNTLITGQTVPKTIRQGRTLLAGMRVNDDAHSIKMRVTAVENDSYLAKLDQKIALAHLEKAPLETASNKILQYFIPAVIILAIIVGIVIGILFPPVLAIQAAICVLVSACPCVLGLVVPLAIKIGIAKAADHGVQFKSGKSLQAANTVNKVVFDLNGTLTKGKPVVKSVKLLDHHLSKDELLNLFGMIERHSNHPMAKAISHYVNKRRLKDGQLSDAVLTKLDKKGHTRLRAEINDKWYTIGNKNMMTKAGIDMRKFKTLQAEHPADHIIYLARENKVIGYIVLSDPLRDDAKSVIKTLQNKGKEVHICTGADRETALGYAQLLGIPEENVQAECLAMTDDTKQDKPSKQISKENYIKQLQADGGKVAMIGDAGNDALAIASSDLGIAVKSDASDIGTQDNAGVIIHDKSLLPVVTAFAVAKQTVNNIKQNLITNLTYNLAAIIIITAVVAVGFAINPAIGAALMIVQVGIVLLMAYRFKQQSLSHVKKPTSQSEAAPTEDNQHSTTKKLFNTFTPQPNLAPQSSKVTPIKKTTPQNDSYSEQERSINTSENISHPEIKRSSIRISSVS